MKTLQTAFHNRKQYNIASQHQIGYGSIFLLIMFLLVISCSENEDLEITEHELTLNSEPPIDHQIQNDDKNPNYNETSIVNYDINLMLPQDWVTLNYPFLGSSANVIGMFWEKINGPVNYNFAYSNSEYTTISDLIEGNYQFELTVNYLNGSVTKDTINVNVHDVSVIPEDAGELIIENVQWTFPWYATLEVPNVYSKITPESLFRIFVKRDGSTNWEDVPGNVISGSQNSLYDYFIERRLPDGAGMYSIGSLFILYYGSTTSDSPDIKIVYW